MPPRAKSVAGSHGRRAAAGAAAAGAGAGAGAGAAVAKAGAGLPRKGGRIDLLAAVRKYKIAPGTEGTGGGGGGGPEASASAASSGQVVPAALEGPIQ